jgi:hypothetical protein
MRALDHPAVAVDVPGFEQAARGLVAPPPR